MNKTLIQALSNIKSVVRDPLPEDPSLEEVLRNEIQYLEASGTAHAEAADHYLTQASDYKDKLLSAGLKA